MSCRKVRKLFMLLCLHFFIDKMDLITFTSLPAFLQRTGQAWTCWWPVRDLSPCRGMTSEIWWDEVLFSQLFHGESLFPVDGTGLRVWPHSSDPGKTLLGRAEVMQWIWEDAEGVTSGFQWKMYSSHHYPCQLPSPNPLMWLFVALWDTACRAA